jgi:1,4-alpha-glucan branching enzyme
VGGNELGYPRDFDYRGSHLRSGTSGLQYWRITGAKVEAANRDVYHPDWAAYKIEQHAEHFAHLVGDQLRSYNQATQRPGLVVSSFNADLFGHWWFEGIAWLGKVLRHMAHSTDINLVTMTAFMAKHPPTERVELRESSWGIGGLHFFWENEENRWVWEAIHIVEERMERLAERFTAPTADEATVLAQAAREVLLLQASDWSFLITTGQARAYAIRRFTEHTEHFDTLADSLDAGTPDTFAATAYWRQNTVFADVDYRWFRTQKQ